MTGGCQCGAIRYKIASFPLLLYTCPLHRLPSTRPAARLVQQPLSPVSIPATKVPSRWNRLKPLGIDLGLGGYIGRVRRGQSEERYLGIRRHSGGRLHPGAHVSNRGGARNRQDHDRAPVPDGRRARWREMPLHHAVRNRARVAAWSRLTWLEARRANRNIRAAAAGEPARFRAAAEPAVFLRP